MFDFSNIKKEFDVLVWFSEGATTDFMMDFSDKELASKIQNELVAAGLKVYEMSANVSLWVKNPTGLNLVQITERVCTTLEIKGYKVERKVCPKGKFLDNVEPIQSFILG